jgi:hypothetical protein
MSPKSIASLLLSSCFAAGVVAQNMIVPAIMDGVEGGGGTNIPFGGSLACRYQCVYDAEELPWTGPRVMTGIRIRPDLGTGAPRPAKGFLEISVLMSTTGRNAATSSPTFSENYGTDHTWVIQNRVVQLPAQPQLPSPVVGPRPANIDLTFDAPWVFGLTPVITGEPEPDNLLVEIWIHSQPSGSYRVDNMSSCAAPTATFGLVGPACSVPGNQPVELTGDVSMQAGSNYTWRISNAPPTTAFSISLNLENTGGLLGVPTWPLPYPLFDLADPSQPSAALVAGGLLWPAPDCYINMNAAASIGGITDAAGDGDASLVLPPDRELVGADIYSQALVLAPTANPLFLITSAGRSTTVCGPLGVARIYQFYNASGTPTPPPPNVGSRSLGVGLVLEVF